MTTEADARAAADKEWSRRVADIAIGTCLVAKALTQEQSVRCTEITAEEIYIRLVLGDRPPV